MFYICNFLLALTRALLEVPHLPMSPLRLAHGINNDNEGSHKICCIFTFRLALF